jgi:hypothetical protein
VFTPFHKPPYTYPYGRSVDETTTFPVGSIAECASVGELLEKIKSQFTGSSKKYGT